MEQLITIKDIEEARGRVASTLEITPLTRSDAFSTDRRSVYLKWDNRLTTGSFKERGACNFLMQLSDSDKGRGVFAASAGNHALALSHHARRLGISCTIVMPVHAPLVKVQRTRASGAQVHLKGTTFDEAVAYATEMVEQSGGLFVPAFNHAHIIAGQGVCGLEILEQFPDLDSVIVPVGGGGLISGIAMAIKEKKKDVFVLGVQSEWAARARKLAHNNGPLSSSSIADGIAVKTIGTLTTPLIDSYVDEIVTVSESEIARAIMALLEREHAVVEGAGAAGIAALLKNALPRRCKRTVVEICGSNIDLNLLSRLIERHQSECNRLLDLQVSVPDRPGSLEVLVKAVAEERGNVLQVLHDRSFSQVPGNVDIELVIEVADEQHRQKIIDSLREKRIALTVRENLPPRQ